MSSTPKSSLASMRNFGTETVAISVGKEGEKEDLIIHSKLICHYSEYFSKAFVGPFAEGQAKAWHWKVWDLASPEPTSLDLIGLWILADTALIPRLQDETLNYINFHRAIDHGPYLDRAQVDHIWKDTGEGSAIRAYIVDEIVRGKLKVAEPKFLPQEMLAELFTARGNIPVQPRPALADHEMAKYLVEEVSENVPQAPEPRMVSGGKEVAENAG